MLLQPDASVRLKVPVPCLPSVADITTELPLTAPIKLGESPPPLLYKVPLNEVADELKIVNNTVPVSGVVTPFCVFVPELVPVHAPFRLVHWASVTGVIDRRVTRTMKTEPSR